MNTLDKLAEATMKRLQSLDVTLIEPRFYVNKRYKKENCIIFGYCEGKAFFFDVRLAIGKNENPWVVASVYGQFSFEVYAKNRGSDIYKEMPGNNRGGGSYSDWCTQDRDVGLFNRTHKIMLADGINGFENELSEISQFLNIVHKNYLDKVAKLFTCHHIVLLVPDTFAEHENIQEMSKSIFSKVTKVVFLSRQIIE